MKMPRFVKDSGTLISGNVLAQGIALLAYLVLTRLFTPEDNGSFNVFYSYIEVLIIVSTCKYELGIVAAKDTEEAAAVARFALRINTVVSITLLIVITLLIFLGVMPSNLQSIGWVALLIPFLVFFIGTNRVYEMLFNRFKEFKQSAISQIVNSTSGALFKILFGITGRLHSAGLPLGVVLGQMCGNINYRIRLKKLALPSTSKEVCKTAARKHVNYALYTAPKDFVTSFSANLPFLWTAAYFGEAEIGLFGLALTFTFRPTNILATAFENVLYVRVAEKVRFHQPILKDLNKFLGLLYLVAVPLFAAAYYLAEPIFGLVFGSRWSGCGEYVQALLPWMFVMIGTNSLMFMANVFNMQKYEFVFSIVLLCLRITALAVGIGFGSFQLSIWSFSIATSVVMAALGIWYYSMAFKYESSLTHNKL